MLRKRISVKVRQNDISDCGAAALASVAAHGGIRCSVSVLRHMSGTDQSGTSVKGLVEASKSIGIGAEAFKGTKDSLSLIPKPAILHMKKKEGRLHYVVLTQSSGKYFKVMDPADGQIHKQSLEQICMEWTGVLLLFTFPQSGKTPPFTLAPHVKNLLTNAQQGWKIYPVSTVISIFGTLSMAAVALFIKELIDSVIPDGNQKRLVSMSAILIVITVVSIFLSAIRSYLLLKHAVNTEEKLTGSYLSHLCSIPLPFYSTFKTGELTSRISDIYRIRNFIAETLPDAVISLLTLVISFILLFGMNPGLALVCTLFIPLYAAVFILHDRARKPLFKRLMEKGASFQGYIIESLKSMATIRNFGMENYSLSKASSKFRELKTEMVANGRIAIIAGSSSELATRLLTVTVLWTGGSAVVSGKITAGEMVSFYALAALFTAPMQQLASSFTALREGLTASYRLHDIMSVHKENQSDCKKSEHMIEARNISFGYPGRRLLFRNLSFSMHKGKVLLIKGKSGCGKSTVVSLLMKHLEPLEGEVACNLAGKCSLVDYRKNIALVPQNPQLWGDSIMECIIPGNGRELDCNYFTSIVKELELDKMAMRLPFGFSTHPGEGGALLSRGEQQRIAFARALMKKAPVLLMDEATASLDNKSESLIRDSLLKLKGSGCAILIVSHDQKMVEIADYIIDMDNYSCNILT